MKEKVMHIRSAEAPSTFAQYPDGIARAKAAHDLIMRGLLRAQEAREKAEAALADEATTQDIEESYPTELYI